MLNYALVLEYLQAAFYTEAERAKGLSGRAAGAAKVVGAVERAHVKAFRDLLGSKAVGRPHFDFQGVTEANKPFLKTAVAFEDLAVAAYKGQARQDPQPRRAHVRAGDPHRRGAPRRVDALPEREHARRGRVRPAAHPQGDRRHRRVHGVHRAASDAVEPARAALLGVTLRVAGRRGAVALGLVAGATGGVAVIAAAASPGEDPPRRPRRRARTLAAPVAPGARDPAAARAHGRPPRHALGLRPARDRGPPAARSGGGHGRPRRAPDARGHADRAAGRPAGAPGPAARCGSASTLPVLPNGTQGWIRRRALGAYEVSRHRLVVDRARMRLTLLRGGRVVMRAPVGVGQARWPTPRGTFLVRNRLEGYTSPQYGPVAFGTSARSPTLTDWPAGGFVGIHGTDRPDLIPGRVSHGCVRLRNPDMLRLSRLMPVGTQVEIR